MNSPHGVPERGTRRSFLVSGGGVITSAWLVSQWPQIAAAAEHAEHGAHAGQMVAAAPESAGFSFLSTAEAADVDAVAAQIVPSGATPGARYKSVQVTRIVHDFYDSDPKRGFYGGGGIDGRMGSEPASWALAQGGELPRWGAELKSRLEAFTRSMVAAGHCTSLAVETNSVSIDPELKDAWGIPAIRVTYQDHPDDLSMARFLQDRCAEIMDAAGARRIWRAEVRNARGGVHLLGTCRMGDDPASSVIDKYHRTHDVRNLFLCDGSSFVTSGRGQPTMTIQALAFRAADHIGRLARRNEI